MELRLLGPLDAVDDRGMPLPLGAPRQQMLLASLALRAGEVCSADRLIDEIWGERPPASAAHAIQVYVSNLRRALGAGRIVTRAPGYVLLLGPGELDLESAEQLAGEGGRLLAQGDAAAAGEQLRASLALWRGDPLPELAFERFAQPAIARLAELRLTTLERRIDADLAAGRHGELTSELQQLVGVHALRERFWEQLVLALYRQGRQAEALAAYRRARETLVEELGLEPGPALVDLERAVLRQDPALSAPAVARPAPLRQVVLVAGSSEGARSLLPLARRLAVGQAPHEIVLVRLATSPDGLAAATAELSAMRGELGADGIAARTAALRSAGAEREIARLATVQDASLVVWACEIADPPELAGMPCDAALLVASAAAGDGHAVTAFGGDSDDWAAIELAAWLTEPGGTLRIAGGIRADRDAGTLLAHAGLALQAVADVSVEPVLIDGPAALAACAEGAGALVVSLPAGLVDDHRRELAARVTCPLLLVRRGPRPGGLAPPAQLTRFSWSLADGQAESARRKPSA